MELDKHKHEFSLMVTAGKSFHICLECKLQIEHKDFMPGWEMRLMVDELLQYMVENIMPIPSEILKKYESKTFNHVNPYMIPALENLDKAEVVVNG